MYHSSRAYEYVRKRFHNHLPNIKTIRNWFANSDIRSDPGIQEDHMERLRKIANDFEKKHNRKLMCSLVFDEMNIRQQIFWSSHHLDYIGYVNFGQDPESEKNTIAKQAIVFVLNGIEVNFEFPIAYYFIDTLNKHQRKHLLNNIIATIVRCGIKVTNVTFDGLSGNAAMCKLFGANLNVLSPEFQPYLLDPMNNEKIYIILDPVHMEKLVRNTLSNRAEFFANDKEHKIEWRYIVALYEYSKEHNLQTHKLSKKHIDWKRNPMNVRLATETFSNSVADSIEYLMNQNILDFQGAESTIDLIRRMDKLFNIFNSKYSKAANIYKRVLSAENKRIIFDFIRENIEYFKTLKVEEPYFVGRKRSKTAVKKFKLKPLLSTRHKCAFRGFIIDMVSLMGMYTEYIEQSHLLTSIATYNLLQDVIEMLFGRIRACGGFNNNPNVQQFKGAFRKIQANMKLDLSPNSNCRAFDLHLPDNLFYSNIYFVSSKRAKIAMDPHIYEQQKDSILEELVETMNFDDIAMDVSNETSNMLDTTPDFMIAFIASSIERKIIECNSIHCNECISVFHENEKMDTLNTNLLSWKPCISTMQICKTSEQFFKLYDVKKIDPRFDFKVLYCLIFRTMNLDAMYPSSKFNCDLNHKYQFIKCVVGQYICTRASQISKQFTLKRQDKIIRQQFNHLVLYKGQ